MSETPIVTGEVVEVERMKRPELWIPVWFDDEKRLWSAEYPRADKGDAGSCHNRRPLLGDIIVYVPAETDPQPSREPDPLSKFLKLDASHVVSWSKRNNTFEALDADGGCYDGPTPQAAAAAACLARIKADAEGKA